jgi:transcriptional regulator with XRE-family HTH domain
MTLTPGQIGMELKKLRKAKNLSRYALANAAGVSREYVRKLEDGESDPTVGMLQKLAKALGVPLMEPIAMGGRAKGGGTIDSEPKKRGSTYLTQWAAQFLVAGELTRRGYLISFPFGNAPATDIHATSPNGTSFPVEIKGLKSANFWLVRKPRGKDLRLYILALVPQGEPLKAPRYFVLTAKDLLLIHVDDPKWPGMNWGAVLEYESRWDKLPP